MVIIREGVCLGNSLNIPNNEKKEVPSTAEGRIRGLMELPLHQKENFLPSSGYRFQMGPFIYEVAVVNAGKLRFTARLCDVVIEGINDGKSDIIDPITGTNFVKE